MVLFLNMPLLLGSIVILSNSLYVLGPMEMMSVFFSHNMCNIFSPSRRVIGM